MPDAPKRFKGQSIYARDYAFRERISLCRCRLQRVLCALPPARPAPQGNAAFFRVIAAGFILRDYKSSRTPAFQRAAKTDH